MILKMEHKNKIIEHINNFLRTGTSIPGKILILLKIENSSIIETESEFIELLETNVYRLIGQRPEWIVGGIEYGKVWIGMTVSLTNTPCDTLIIHDNDYHFLVVV